MDGLPDCRVVHHSITVDQCVAHSDRRPKLGHPRGDFRCLSRQVTECLADDLELAFHRRTEHQIGFLTGEIAILNERRNAIGGLADVPQPRARIMLHKVALASVRCRPE
jgi:hypothetical protein